MGFWEITAVITAAVCLLAFLGHRLSVSAGKKAAYLIKAIDEKYRDFVEKSIVNAIVADNSFQLDTQKISEEALIVLKPEIDAIISHVNATDLSSVKIKYRSLFFKNAVTLAEEYFLKRHNRNTEPISQKDTEKFYESIKDAIRADLTKRAIDLKAGNF